MSSTSIDREIGSTGSDVRERHSLRRSRAFVIGAVASSSLLGSILLVALSREGVHASNDSFTYLGAANNLAQGEGWTYPFGDVGSPVTLFPPLYPLLLTVPRVLGVPTFGWVFWQNAVLLCAFGVAVGLTVADATRDRAMPSVLAALLVQLGTPTLMVYAHIWSETLFFPLIVLILASLARHLATRRTGPLIVAAALTSVAMLTRYAGLSALATSCLLLLVWPGHRALDRARAIGLYAGISLPLSALWSLRNLNVSGTLTGDNELVHDLTWADVAGGFQRIGSWFIPDRPTGWAHDALVLLVVLAVVTALIVLAWTTLRSRPTGVLELPPVVPVCVAFAALHFAFIAAANAFSTRAPPFNDRLLGPAFAPLVIAAVALGDRIYRAAPRRLLAGGTVGAAAASLVALAVLAATHSMPMIYGTRVGSAAEYEELARTLEGPVTPGAALFATRPNVAWFLLDRPVMSLPRSCRGGRVLPNPAFGSELAELSRRLMDRPRQVVIFRRSKECAPFSIPRLKRALRLAPVSAKGLVWVLSGPVDG
jgi:hypothetical protein